MLNIKNPILLSVKICPMNKEFHCRNRISITNVIEVWSVANSTLHEGLAVACLPVIESNLGVLCQNQLFCSSTKPVNLARILADQLIKVDQKKPNVESYADDNAEEDDDADDDDNNEADDDDDDETDIIVAKVQMLTNWLENGTDGDGLNRFTNLISCLKLNSLDVSLLFELYTIAMDLGVPKESM